MTRSGSGRASPLPNRPRSSGSAVRVMSAAGPVALTSHPASCSVLTPASSSMRTAIPPGTVVTAVRRPACTDSRPAQCSPLTRRAVSGGIRCRCTSQ